MNEKTCYLPFYAASDWVTCAAWPQAQYDNPRADNEVSDEREEGTQAHKVFTSIMLGNGIPENTDVEMVNHAKEAASALHSLIPQNGWRVETELRGKAVHDSQNWGRPDAIGWKGMDLHVAEYKYGHRFVSEFRNWQLLNAAVVELGNAKNIDGLVEQKVNVHLHVLQPRCYGHPPFRTWTLPAGELRAFANLLRGAADAATRMDRRATPGPHCYGCRGAHACSVLRQSALVAIDSSARPAPQSLSPDGVGTMLTLVQIAQDRLAALQQGLQTQAEFHARKGSQIPGWKMESVPGREHWTAPDEEVIAMGKLFGKDLSKPKVITPNQARQVGIPDFVLSSIVARSPGPLKLVPDDGKKAAQVFGTGA